jgi:hypothetical protein
MTRKLWLIGLTGLFLVTAGCAQKQAARPNPKPMTQAQVLPAPAPPPAIDPQATTIPTAPTLLPPDAENMGTVGILEERADPFAALPMAPIFTRKQKPAASPAAAAAAAAPATTAATTATTATAAIARPASRPAPTDYPYPPAPPTYFPYPAPPAIAIPATPPMISVPVAPPVPQIAMAERIQISGVVELNGSRKVIVQVPNERSSRYVSVGDILANGVVRVKKVTIVNGEPSIIFEQDGKEFIRSVGGMLTDG